MRRARVRAGQLHATWALPLSKIPPLQREHSPALRIDPYLSTYFFVSTSASPRSTTCVFAVRSHSPSTAS